MPIGFASEAWPRPGLAEPRSASLAGFGFFHQHIRKGKVVITKTSKEKRLLLGSFLAPETDMIFGDGVGASPVYTFPTPKMGIKQIEQFSDIILRILRFLAESSGVAKLELFQRFPHCKWVSAGVPTPPDSGKTPQLKTSKLAQNCGKTEVLHL